MSHAHQPNEAIFLERYALLNPAQREAVDAIYGPVMVIAGPGTGKTEVLAMRIAALLRSDAQINPYEILCLTFTEEATVAMRRRLLQIIGEDAHKIHIYTFHAFCNQIIQTNLEYFGIRDLKPISDLERMEILYDIIEKLPEDNALRRLKGNLYYDARYLKSLFDLMKTEAWTPDRINEAIDFYLQDIRERDEFKYKRGNTKKGIKPGDLKEEQIKKEEEKMKRTRAAAAIYYIYQQRLNELGRYDFNDMILWVLKAFKEHPDFLRRQQERFQFLLVDEFQDTSGAQSELLYLLADYWDEPNLFVVGDDDQAIFEFQGARIKNITEFYEKHKQAIKVIVLKENYRSSQNVLNPAMDLIRHNEDRLIRRLSELNLDKNLVAANPRFQQEQLPAVEVRSYYNQIHEDVGIVLEIEKLQAQGVPLSQIAVLYAQHKQSENIISLLEKKGIPYYVKRPVNILELPLITQVLDILQYLVTELKRPFSGEYILFRILNAPFTHIDPLDVAALYLEIQKKDCKHKHWRYLMQDSLWLETLGLKKPTPIHRLGTLLENLLRQMQALTLPMLLEHIFYEGGIAAYILESDNQIWNMQVLYTFFSFVKEETEKQPRMSVSTFLEMIDKMNAENIPVPIQKISGTEQGVRFYTAFAAKGHEFEYVFIIGANKNFWEGKTGGHRGFSLPDTLTQEKYEEEKSPQEEVSRRLFYVAMTRAKKYLYISYAENDNKGKPLEPSVYVDEISHEQDRKACIVPPEQLTENIIRSLLPDPPVSIALAREELLKRRLESYVLSVSAMNLYIKCQLSFYYEKILGVPQAKSDTLGFGTAIHYALEQYYKKMIDSPERTFPGLDFLLLMFKKSMQREESSFTQLQYERRMELGIKLLTEYHASQMADLRTDVKIEAEYKIYKVIVEGVPLLGNIDKIEINGTKCKVVDYKTGSPDRALTKELSPPSDDNPYGGNYWRQMVFYYLLISHYPQTKGYTMTEGVFEFIEKNREDKYVKFTVPILEQDIYLLKRQIKEVYARIMNFEFDKGCGKEDCYWCNFSKRYSLSKPFSLIPQEDEER